MREADLAALLGLVGRLSGEQKAALGRALASASGEPEAVRLIEAAFAAAPRCPHCGATGLQRWGRAGGPRRHRCATCRKTLNALTGTSLARLRKKACWLRYGEALAAGMSLTKAAAHCGVHLTTSFRWRHRFLRAPAAARETLGGVVEADETFWTDPLELGGGFDAKCDRCECEVRVVRSGRRGAPRRPRAACGSRGSGAAYR